MFTAQEYYRMFWVYARNDGNARAAARAFALEYPNIETPNEDTFRRLASRLYSTGSMMPRGSEVGRPAAARNPGIVERILDAVEADPTISVRILSRRLNVSTTTVHGILRDRMLHPYKYVRVQQLLPGDYIQRVHYSRWLLGEVRRNPSFTTYILWTDEAIFNREGCFNSHNMHVWSDENPLALRPRAAQVRWSINLWAGICGEFIVGPYILPDRLDGPAYKYFLEHVLPDLMDDIPYEIRQNMYYQHDGAGPHYANIVRDYLGETFQDRWIGRGGQEAHVAWPPRSPDMNPLDFFFWGYLKNEVYRQPVDTPEEAIALIHAAVENITPQTLQGVQRHLILRAQTCVDNDGRHVEQFFN